MTTRRSTHTLDALLSVDEVAEYLQIPRGTLANWRYQGIGPTYIRVGRHVRYRANDVDDWLDAHTKPTDE